MMIRTDRPPVHALIPNPLAASPQHAYIIKAVPGGWTCSMHPYLVFFFFLLNTNFLLRVYLKFNIDIEDDILRNYGTST
jgi:hypothetical protein